MILQSEVGTYLLWSQSAYYRRHFWEVNIADFPKRQNDIRSFNIAHWCGGWFCLVAALSQVLICLAPCFLLISVNRLGQKVHTHMQLTLKTAASFDSEQWLFRRIDSKDAFYSRLLVLLLAVCGYGILFYVISSQGHNIFANLCSKEYSNMMQLLKQAILSTDLTLHFE